jgi:UDP-N-acetylglucosamine transferase subunit ALG13
MRTLFISTDGGHLTELVAIAERLPAEVVDGAVWACIDSEQSRSVLAHKQSVIVPRVKVKDALGVLRSIPVAHRLQREWKFTQVISTGSGIALAYLPYLALRGATAHYIESATRLQSPSFTGKIMQRVPGIRLYTQYEHLAHGRWNHAGWIYDGFTATEVDPAPIKRAVVVVGTTRLFPFRRLLDTLVPLLGAGGALERHQGSPVETLWQTGSTPVEGLDIDGRSFVPAAELEAAIADADLVIGHAGAGTSLSALTHGRLPVLVPRDTSRGEIMDEHQHLFASLLDERGIALKREPEQLTVEDLVKAAGHRVDVASNPPPFRLRT